MAHVRAKLEGKRNAQQEADVIEWIEKILGEKLPAGAPYEEVLKDGQLLCRVMNKLQPGAIAKIHTEGSEFKMMENINNFQKAAKAYGVPDLDIFQTVDLWNRRDIGAVTTTIFALGRASYKHSEWPGPWVGPKPSD